MQQQAARCAGVVIQTRLSRTGWILLILSTDNEVFFSHKNYSASSSKQPPLVGSSVTFDAQPAESGRVYRLASNFVVDGSQLVTALDVRSFLKRREHPKPSGNMMAKLGRAS